MTFRLPDETHRIMICGRTGSGKTVFGAWLLSHAPFDRIPYIIVNHKRDRTLAGIPYAKTIELKDKLPKEPGLYQTFPMPGNDDDLEEFFWRVRHRASTGLLIDEGYEVDPKSKAFRAILTQGRSLHIPVIMLTQRPSWINRFIISEADFYSYFHLNDERDRSRLQEFTPPEWDIDRLDEPYWSRWYDVQQNFSARLAPVPMEAEIYDKFERRLKPKRRWL